MPFECELEPEELANAYALLEATCYSQWFTRFRTERTLLIRSRRYKSQPRLNLRLSVRTGTTKSYQSIAAESPSERLRLLARRACIRQVARFVV